MLIAHNKNGCGSGRSAQEYLEAKHDSNGIERTEIKILRGDPASTTAVIDTIENKWKYSSAVIAWTKDDNPSDEQIEKVLEDYYALGFAGMEEDRYSSYAVLHREQNGGVHVHIISARMDLQSGKAHNPCPPNVEHDFNQISKYYNYKEGWDRPDDPDRVRESKKEKHEVLIDAQEVKKGLKIEPDTQQLLTDFIANRAEFGLVTCQADVVESLKEFGVVGEVRRSFIALKLEGEEKEIKLKGKVFNAKFNRKNEIETSKRSQAGSRIDDRESNIARRRFEKACEKKCLYNIGRYGESDRETQRPIDFNHRTTEGTRLVDKKASFDNSFISSSGLNDRHAVGVGDAKLPDKQNFRQSDRDSETRSDVESGPSGLSDRSDKGQNILVEQEKNSRSQKSESGRGMVRPANRGVKKNENLGENRSWRDREAGTSSGQKRPKGQQNRGRHNRTTCVSLQALSQRKLDADTRRFSDLLLLSDGRLNRRQLDGLRQFRITCTRGGLDDDRARIEAFGHIARARKNDARISKASRDVSEKSRRLSESRRKNDARISRANRDIVEKSRRIRESFRKHMNNSEDELQRFKTEINLSEYLASHGFELDEHKSCTSYAVMRKNDLKYVVTQDRNDAHYVFTDAHNPANSGSVIDACQSLTGKNLGQVRKELRHWIGANKPSFSNKKYQKNIKKSETDFAKVAVAFDNAKSVFDYSYFESRCIEKSTVNAFSETIKQSVGSTILFRHFNAENPAVSGFEYKSKDYAGFSKGGQKGLCVFRQSDPAELKKVVICETAIDALSKAQLDKMPRDTAYVSLAGNPSLEQLEQLKAVVQHYDLDAVIAVDRDPGGDLIAEQILKVLPGTSRTVPGGKDWNEDLQKYQFEKQKKLGTREERGVGMSM